MTRARAMDVMNDATTMQIDIDAMLRRQDDQLDWSPEIDWQPGDPLYEHPYMRDFVYVRHGEETSEVITRGEFWDLDWRTQLLYEGYGPQWVRPMAELFENDDTMESDYRMRCQPCGVNWHGDEPCWNCGEARAYLGNVLVNPHTFSDQDNQMRGWYSNTMHDILQEEWNQVRAHFNLGPSGDIEQLVRYSAADIELTRRMIDNVVRTYEPEHMRYVGGEPAQVTPHIGEFRGISYQRVRRDEAAMTVPPDPTHVVVNGISLPIDLDLSPRSAPKVEDLVPVFDSNLERAIERHRAENPAYYRSSTPIQEERRR